MALWDNMITFFTIWKTVLKVKWRIGEDFATVSANETLRMEGLTHRLQTILKNVRSKQINVPFKGKLFTLCTYNNELR